MGRGIVMSNLAQKSELIQLLINGQTEEIYIRHSDTLLFTLREQLGLMGAKPGCENGDCGSCTVFIGGTPMNACHMLTIEVGNEKITTIEGLSDNTMQEAFTSHWALQCGYCTPGFILNTYALAKTNPNASEETINEWLDPNISRCTGYQGIKQAVKVVLKNEREKQS